MADLQKHQDERIDFAVGFADKLTGSESLDTIQALEVWDDSRTDVSAEFGSPTGVISGDDVQFRLDEAGSGAQSRFVYKIYIQVLTTDNDLKVATDGNGNLPELLVTKE